MLYSLSPKTWANRDVTNPPQSLHTGIVQSLRRTWQGRICGRSLSAPSTFFAVLMSFVRLCNVLGSDVFSTATAGTTSCRFGDFDRFLGSRLSERLCSLIVRFYILISGFQKDVFCLLGGNARLVLGAAFLDAVRTDFISCGLSTLVNEHRDGGPPTTSTDSILKITSVLINRVTRRETTRVRLGPVRSPRRPALRQGYHCQDTVRTVRPSSAGSKSGL